MIPDPETALAMLFAALAGAILSGLFSHMLWWQPELPKDVRRLVDWLDTYRVLRESSAHLPLGALDGQLEVARRQLGAELEAVLLAMDLSPLDLPYPEVMRKATTGLEEALAPKRPTKNFEVALNLDTSAFQAGTEAVLDLGAARDPADQEPGEPRARIDRTCVICHKEEGVYYHGMCCRKCFKNG